MLSEVKFFYLMVLVLVSLRKQRCGRLKGESVLSSTSACGIPGEAKVIFHI